MAKKVEIGTEISRGWELFKGNMGLLILATLLMGVCAVFTCLILLAPLMAGNFLIIQRLLKKDPAVPQVGDLFKGFDYFLNAFLFALVTGIIMVIPGVNILGILSVPLAGIGIMFIVFGKMGFAEAMKKIFNEISSGPFWLLILTTLIACIIGNLGLGVCGIGALFTWPLASCIIVCAYHTAYEGADAEQPPPVEQTPEAPPPPMPEA